uniref:Forkhead box J1 n=1 Tax=Leptochiton asellus TaxID=211853 RepID=A0A288XNL0_9MOLL|nr:forkhead box J1 [Leptochiton asellus]
MLMYITDESGNMHEITDIRSSMQVHRPKTASIKVIRSDSLPGKPARIKLTPASVKTVQHRRNTVNVPVVTRDHLAHRFRQNWLAKYPMDTCSNGAGNLDDSLTSLNWLQNLNIMKLASPTPPPSPLTLTDNTKVNPNAVLNMTNSPSVRMEPRGNIYGDLTPPPSLQDKVDYKTNPCVKPPYSYATLICMAMQETQKQKITLSAIYNWITENFAYYRMAEPSWQNSIRHNLSLNKCFQKVPRRKDEPGKGGFWRINPEFSDSFENGVFKKRRCSRDSYPAVNMPPFKKIKKEVDDDSYNSSADNSRVSTDSNGFHHEDSSNPFLNFPSSVSDEDGDMLSREFNWSSLLGQDIQVDGRTIKAEDLLDEAEHSLASPLIDMSPPPSESNSDDMGLEDLLSQTDFSQDVALDFTTNDPLDLTVSGTGLNPPNWWNESFTFPGDSRELIEAAASASSRPSGLNTPIAQSPAYEDDGLSWDQHTMPAAFDMDNLFDIENIPSPQL